MNPTHYESVSVTWTIVYIYSLGKKFFGTYLKTRCCFMQNLLTRKCAIKLVKIWEKRKKCGRPIDDMKTRKNTNLFCCYKNTQQ